MEYAVSRDGTTLVTLHEGTDTTACDEATRELTRHLESLATDGPISTWSITDAEVYEHPTAPFDPYTITVAFTLTVVVDADGSDAAEEAGANTIAAALEAADVETVSYTSTPAASTC